MFLQGPSIKGTERFSFMKNGFESWSTRPHISKIHQFKLFLHPAWHRALQRAIALQAKKITFFLLFFWTKFQFSFNDHDHKIQSEGIGCCVACVFSSIFSTMTRKSGNEKKWKSCKTIVLFLKADKIQSMLGILSYWNRCHVRRKFKK